MFEIKKIILSIRKLFTKRDVVFILILISAYFLTRLLRLDQFPIFSDEGIYIHWAKVAWHDASWRFISLTDGKQPLQTWGTIPFLKLFPQNALLAGRLFSVATGFAGQSGMFVLLWYLFGKRAAFLGSFLYVLTPYFLFYDRMALVDSAVNAGFIWIFFLSILLARTQRLDVAIIFGLTTGLSLLAKSSVRIFLALSAFAPLLTFEKKRKGSFWSALNFYFLFAVVGVISLIVYNVQRLSPFFHFVAEKNKTFIMTWSEFMKAPFSLISHNIQIIPVYVVSEMGWIVGIISLLGFLNLVKNDKKLAGYFSLWIVLPFIAIALFSKVIYPRYLMFFGSFLLIFVSYYLSQTKRVVFPVFLLITTLASFFYFDYAILFNPARLPLPEIDRGQYVEGATAAWGAREIVDYVRLRSTEKPTILLAEGNFGLVGDVLDVFVRKDDRIFIKGYWPLEEKDLIANQKEIGKNLVFVVYAQKKEFPQNWPIKLIKKYDKPGNKSAIYLFELTN